MWTLYLVEPTLDARPDSVVVPDTPGSLDFFGNFPSTELVGTAAALFPGHVVPERMLTVSPDGKHRLTASELKTLELFGKDPRRKYADREMIEGPRWRVVVSPGVVAVRFSDPARAERSHERAVGDARARANAAAARMQAGLEEPDPAPGRGVSAWSARSRARMVARLAELDYAPLFAHAGERPAMVTLTYPGDWLAVAPDPASCRRHLLALRKRFERAYGRPLACVWKREFQRRGAPHFHLLMVPPHQLFEGRRMPDWWRRDHVSRGVAVPAAVSFKVWLSATWADVVAHPDADERLRHFRAGTGVDFAEGARARDPKRLGIYFAKHGAFKAKEYQNVAPQEWAGASVGRFWGYWGLEAVALAVAVSPVEADAMRRTMRRYAASGAPVAKRPVWRRKWEAVDFVTESGEVRQVKRARWVQRQATRRVKRVTQASGFLVVNDGAAFAGYLARVAEMAGARHSGAGRALAGTRGISRGAGPIGFLP